jgi:hypothetical protein
MEFLKILMMLVKALETNNVISAVQLVPQELLDTSILLKNSSIKSQYINSPPQSQKQRLLNL